MSWCVIAGALALAQAAAQAQSSLPTDSRAWEPPQDRQFAVTLSTPPPQSGFLSRGGAHELHSQPAQPASLSLDFRRASAHQQAKDLLRVQLTADSVLNFRPRGGGLVVTYRVQF